MYSTHTTQPSDGLRVMMLASDAHGGSGGIAQYNRDVIAAMARMPGIRDIVVLPRIVKHRDCDVPANVHYDFASGDGTLSFLRRNLAHAVRAVRYDLVYCAHINLMPVAAAVAKARRLPLVLAIYGIDAWQRPAGIATRLALSAISMVISISQITLRRFLAWSGVDPAKTAVIPNAIHAGHFGPAPRNGALARRLGLDGRTVLLTFGRLAADERYKGFDEVLEAMPRLTARLPRLVYVIAGDGSDRARLEAKAQALGLGRHVIFAGYVDEAEKADLYRLADAYVMPSSGEGFGFVILEALACGLPVVASAADGTREAVRDGELGLVVDPQDPAALEQAIIEALARPNAVPAGLAYFSFEHFERRLQTALARVVPALAVH